MEGEDVSTLGQRSEKSEVESGKRVLVVDDEPALLRALHRTVGGISQTAKVTSVSSVDEAIKTIKEGLTPDVILSDMTMPNKSGLDFYKWLSENRSNLLKRLYFISAGGINAETIQFLDRMEKEGRLIEKPWTLEAIREKLLGILGEK
jgi:CheY-like chemotaxis protein